MTRFLLLRRVRGEGTADVDRVVYEDLGSDGRTSTDEGTEARMQRESRFVVWGDRVVPRITETLRRAVTCMRSDARADREVGVYYDPDVDDTCSPRSAWRVDGVPKRKGRRATACTFS